MIKNVHFPLTFAVLPQPANATINGASNTISAKTIIIMTFESMICEKIYMIISDGAKRS